MELILALIFSWPVFIGLIVTALIFEHNDATAWTVLITLGLMLFAFFMWNMTWAQIGIIAALWIPIGLIWSVWRWRRHCATVVSDLYSNSINKDAAKSRINPQTAINKITQWVIAWPFSLVESILGDVFDVVQKLIREVFRKTYEKISAKALVKIEQHNQP